MRIGIITYWTAGANYGQALQCFASQAYLRSLGHDAFLIKYRYLTPGDDIPDHSVLGQIRKVFSYHHWIFFIKHLYQKYKFAYINKHFQNHNVDRKFADFYREYIVSTSSIYSQDQLQKNPPEVDVLMCGSDMVWGGGGADPIFFLDFGSNSIRRISIAPSFGQTLEAITAESRARIQNLLSRFHTITVREEEGVRICLALGFPDAKCICDPTLLVDHSVYSKLADSSCYSNCSNKIFVYYLCNEKSYISDLQLDRYLKSNDMACNFVASQQAVSKIRKVFPTISEWLGLIRDSRFIITNSFHGTVFALIFRKQFAVVPLKNENRNTRIKSLLQKVGLLDRICYDSETLSRCMDFQVDYSAVSSKLEDFRDYSRKIIVESLA